MSSCVIPGSFDPVTVGHVSLIGRAASLFDRVTVTVMINIRKAGTLSPQTRKDLLERSLAAYPNVRVDVWDGLLADYMRSSGERCVLRGARGEAEYEAERNAAAINRLLFPDMTTLIMPAEDALSGISSSAVREIAAFSGDPRPFLPSAVAEEIVTLLSNQHISSDGTRKGE